VLLAGLPSAAALVLLHFAARDDLARTLPIEDGFYALSVSHNVAAGDGITIGGIDTNGFQPLWVALNVPLYWIAGGDRYGGLRLSQWLGTLLWLAFVVLVALLARRTAQRHGLRGDMAAVLAAVVAAGSVTVLRIHHNGLETGLLLVLLAVTVLVLDDERPWTAARIAGVGVLLGLLVWTRIDAALFAIALAVVAAWRQPRVLAACALGALLIVPWLAWNLHVDGTIVPTSGSAQTGAPEPGRNADAALRALGAWALPPVFRPSLHPESVPISELVAVCGLVLVGLAWWSLRRARPATPAGPGTRALALYFAGLALWYTLAFESWWFLDRYLAPGVLLALPVLAAAGERVLPARAAWAVAGVTLLANVPLLAVLVAAPEEPPAWASRGSNLGTHLNLNYDPQFTWTRTNVLPHCKMAAFESGTLGHFRPNAINLDGKVNPDALEARRAHRSDDYVRREGVDVLVDIPSGVDRATRRYRDDWLEVTRLTRFVVAVRRDSEDCVTASAAGTAGGGGAG
jgi:hypothetical protein